MPELKPWYEKDITTTLNIQISPALKGEIQDVAEANSVSLSQAARYMLATYIELESESEVLAVSDELINKENAHG